MVDRCEGCPYATGAVGPRGPENAEVCIVGEAPGGDELRTGQPFTGPSGALLSKVLARAGLDIEHVYLTNTLRCRPPVGEAPPREALEACRGRLVEEVTRHPRKLVLALGNSALRSLTREYDSKISQERGRPRNVNGIGRVLPTYHPAAILRSQGLSAKLIEDVKYAGQLVGGARVKDPGQTEWYEAHADDLPDLIPWLQEKPVLSADIETGTKEPVVDGAFNARDPRNQVLCLAVAYEPNKAIVFPGSLVRKYPKRLTRLFTGPSRFIWHNGKFDTAVLTARDVVSRVDEDTMLMAYVLDEGLRGLVGLKEVAADRLGSDPEYDKPIRDAAKKTVKKHGYYYVPKELLYPYAAMDADYTFQIYESMAAELNKKPGLNYAYEHVLIPASGFLREVEQYGVWVNMEENERLRQTIGVQVDHDVKAFQEASGEKFANPGSPQQVLAILNKAGYRVPNTREEVVKELPSSPLTDSLRAYRKSSKALGTYVEGVAKRVEADGRVHSTYLIHGTATGRLSSRNPNMQNVPRPASPFGIVRSQFQAPPGKVLLELDYSQAELRVLAVLSGDERLGEVYRTGRDLHDEVARELFGPDFTSEQRVRAKFVNFGIAYGRGVESLVQEFKMERASAKAMIDGWWRTFPDAHHYIFSNRAAIRQGKLESPFGRRRRFAVIPQSKKAINALENEAANFVIQSTASDLTLLSAISMHSDLVSKFDAHIINLVHDSILIEAWPETAETVDLTARATMECAPEEELGWHFPFQADFKVASRWGDLK